MKRSILLLMSIGLFTFSSCDDNSFPDDLPSCLEEQVKQVMLSSHSETKLELYLYKGENVYMVNEKAVYPDKLTRVLNEKCEVVCEFGGIAGLNTCPDFSENAEFVRVVWEK